MFEECVLGHIQSFPGLQAGRACVLNKASEGSPPSTRRQTETSRIMVAKLTDSTANRDTGHARGAGVLILGSQRNVTAPVYETRFK